MTEWYLELFKKKANHIFILTYKIIFAENYFLGNDRKGKAYMKRINKTESQQSYYHLYTTYVSWCIDILFVGSVKWRLVRLKAINDVRPVSRRSMVRSPTASYQRRYKMVQDASLLSAQLIRTDLASLSSQTSFKKRRDGYHLEWAVESD